MLRVARDGDRGRTKPRYEVGDDNRRIRARYGHSRPVDLGLQAVSPPGVLYHGTAGTSVTPILRSGLHPRGRRAVHLSETVSDAVAVGARHGTPVVLTVDARGLHAAGHRFFRAAPGIWLTSDVPPEALRIAGR